MSLLDDLKDFTKEELLDIINEYDKYIIQFMEEHGDCTDGSTPVCVAEFNDCEYEEILNDRE